MLLRALHAGDLDADLTEDAELIHLGPGLGDLAVFETIEDDGVLGDGLASRRNAGDGSGVGGGHGPTNGGFVAVDDDIVDDEVMVGEHGVDVVDGLAEGGEAGGVDAAVLE